MTTEEFDRLIAFAGSARQRINALRRTLGHEWNKVTAVMPETSAEGDVISSHGDSVNRMMLEASHLLGKLEGSLCRMRFERVKREVSE